MNDVVPELAGLTQKEAEERILDWARERGLLEKREHYRHAVRSASAARRGSSR